MKRVVLLGGGTGSFVFTRALKDLPLELTTIVSSFDDGGSTGAIRRDYGGFAVGDLRQGLMAHIAISEPLENALAYRFGPGHLYGINVGNLLLKAYFEQFKDKRTALAELHSLFGLKHKVLPISYDFAKLEAVLSNGSVLHDESQIASYYSFSSAKIRTLRLSEPAGINPEARQAILQADYLVFAPGHFFTSILPHIYVRGFKEAWQRSKARKVWIMNLLAHNGLDSGMCLKERLGWFERKLGRRPFNLAVANKKVPSKILRQVADRFSEAVLTPDDSAYLAKRGVELLATDLVSTRLRKQHANDPVPRAPLRHDVLKVRKFFEKLLKQTI